MGQADLRRTLCHPLCHLVLLAVLAARAHGAEGRATAGGDEDASADFRQAAELLKKHKYIEALQALERAAALDPTPPVLLNLGRLREETGDLEGAMRAYHTLLARTRDRRLSSEAEGRLRELERRAEPAPAPIQLAPAPQPAALKCPAPLLQAVPQKEARPVHRRFWFWAATVGGALVLTGAAVGITLALHSPGPADPPATDLGSMRFFLHSQ